MYKPDCNITFNLFLTSESKPKNDRLKKNVCSSWTLRTMVITLNSPESRPLGDFNFFSNIWNNLAQNIVVTADSRHVCRIYLSFQKAKCICDILQLLHGLCCMQLQNIFDSIIYTLLLLNYYQLSIIIGAQQLIMHRKIAVKILLLRTLRVKR